MRDHRRVVAVLLVSWLIVAPTAGSQFGLLNRGSRFEFKSFKDPAGSFSLEYPKDWQVFGGTGDVIVILAQKKGEALLVLERFHMNQVLAPQEITDVFAQIEVDVLKERQPVVTDVSSRLVDADDRRLVVIDYARKGLAGPERVRQYSLPIGQELYRVTCSATGIMFQKYEAVFGHAAESFKPSFAQTSERAICSGVVPGTCVSMLVGVVSRRSIQPRLVVWKASSP